MAENNGLYSIQGSTLTDIADAIREKSGSTQQYSPSEMATAVLAIEGGGGGTPGKDGEDGVGIASVVQTTTSTADGGTNVVTVTLTDGSSSTFEVKNGSKGSTGPQGPKGDTGDKGDPGEDGSIAELPGTLTYWSENENAEFGDISTPADTVKMASGKTLESVLAGCWIEFADKDGNPTTEPYIHWYSDPVIIEFSIGETTYSAEEGMTWAEWVDSDYNTDKAFGYSLELSMVYSMDNQLISFNELGVGPTNVILANTNYEIGVVPFPF